MSLEQSSNVAPRLLRGGPGTSGSDLSGPWLPPGSWALLVFFIVLQVGDVVTTNSALAVPGNWEVIPLMNFAQAHLGPSWWIPKLPAVGLAAVVVLHIRRPWPI